MNIQGKRSYAGRSGNHPTSNRCVWVRNSAGSANVQMFFTTADGKVVSALPGFWNPDDFMDEVEVAQKLLDLYEREDSVAQRNEKFMNIHLTRALTTDAKTRRNSQLQGFDRRAAGEDANRTAGYMQSGTKSSDQIIHERMAEWPYVPFSRFDVDAVVCMGLKHYDSHNDNEP